MSNKLACTGLFAFAFCCSGIASASDSEFSATPDYSYDSYRSLDTYSAGRMSSSLSKRDYGSSSHSFSGNVMIDRNRSKGGYSPQPSGYNPQPTSSSSNYNPQRGSNSAYYRTNTYKY